ncbi:MAG TPA: hypothetical protein VJS39_09490, partial [Gemmatimonadaceae bacterium]|nr:hypothetical protein [Gemmatimonadaceae bacterium]
MCTRVVSGLRDRIGFALGIALSVVACSDASGPDRTSSRVAIVTTVVAQNPNNNLSALVRFTTRNADSARLTYHIDPGRIGGPISDQSSPF